MKHFNSFTNWVVKSFRALALTAFVLLGVGNSWAYTITFTTATTDQSTELKTTDFVSKGVSAGSAYISSCTATAKSYVGKSGNKLGTSSLAGDFTLALAASGQIVNPTITIVSTKYGSDTGKLRVYINGSGTQTGGDIEPGGTATLNFTGTITSIKVATSAKRAYVGSIDIAPSCTAITPTLSYGASVNVGNTLNPTLTGNTGSGTVTYSSSNTSVLTVNPSGVVTGVASGSATVTASIAAASTYCAGSATSGTITVNCNSAGASFASSSVSKATTDANFTNTLTTSNTGAKTFASSNTAVATVNATTGEVDVLTAGTTTISVTQPETSGVCAVNTSYSLTVSSACTPATTVWDASTVNKVYGDAAFTNGFLSDNTGAETYASSNTSVATVNATSGLVTITGVGSTTISVTQPETSGKCAVSTNYTLNVACATLATPTGFTAGTVAATTIDFSWNAVPNASSYTLTYTDGGSTLYKTGVAGTNTQLTGLTPSTQYLITVKAVGNGTTYCNSAESTSADVTTTALPTYTLTWNVNGSTSTTSVVQGNAIGTLPTNPTSAACDGTKVFVGWTTGTYTHASVAPTYITTATVPSGNTTYYAVFATETAGIAVNTVLWAENFDHFGTNTPSDAGTGTGTTIYGGATITYTESSTSTKAYNEKLAGGTAPELLLTKTAPGTWTISGIKTGGATGMSLTFLSNRTKFSLTSPTTGISITGSETSWTITATSSVTTFDLVLKNTDTGTNARVDNVELKVTASSSSYSNFATTCCTAHNTSFTNATVTKTDNDAAFTNALINGNVNTSTKAFTSSDPTVATVNATTGEVTILKAGTTTITLTQDADATHCAVDISYTLNVTNQIKNAWMQWPTSGSTKQGLPYVVYGKVNEPGVTDAAGNGAVITAWIGYSSTNNDPSGGGWTWVAAPFNAKQGNDYEYSADLGAVVTTPGTYYYATRFQIGSAAYVYGGYGTGYTFWNGTTSVNQELVVTAASVNWANVQWPASGSCTTGGTFNVYAQVYEAGITDALGQGAGIQVWIGRSTSNATDPNTWDESAWVLASYHKDSGNNDEYVADIATGLTPGTYYYASRIKLGAGAYQYGGYNGGFWNGYFGGSGNLNGKLVVNNATVAWCNLQSPATGSIFPNSEFNAYARVYEDGVTNVAGAGDNLTVWIGYSTSNTNPSTWTNWVAATYTQDYGNDDEYVANIGATLDEGTYYYASRVQLGLGAYKYGGYSEFGGKSAGGFWDGTTYVSGVLTVAQPKYTVTFDVGTGTAVSPLTQASYGASITLPTAVAGSCASSPYDWTFAGWSETALVTTETTTAPTLLAAGASYTPAANKTLYAVYKKTIPGGDAWQQVTTLADITAGTYVILNGSFYLPNAAVTNGPAQLDISTKSVSISGSTLAGTIDTDMQWTFTGTSSAMAIASVANPSNVLYNIANNDGVNVGGTADNWAFETYSTGFAMKDATNSRYCAVYTAGSDWRSYTTRNATNYATNEGILDLYKKVAGSVTTYHSTPICIACDATTLAVTSPQTINLDAAGDAELDISTLVTSNSNGAITYALTPTSANAEVDAATGYFLADAVGTYTVTISQDYGTEAPTPHCPASVTLTITVLATPVVTIVDVTPLTFTANCGEASAAQSVSVSGYNLTANMTATAPTNFLVSSNNSTFGATATFAQTSGTASGTLYIKANPPAGSTNPISGNVTLASTDATTRTLAVSATVSCTPVTVTFLDWDGNSTVWNTYYSGSTQSLPAPTTGACAGWTFSGWTTNNLTAISAGDIVGTTDDNLTLTGNTTYYAVYSQGGGTSTIFSDDFADITAASTTAIPTRANWSSLSKVYPEVGYVKFSSSSAKGVATTDLLSELTGDGTLTFDLQTFGTDNKDVVVTINNGTITTASSAASSTSNTATYTTSSTKTTHTIALNGGGTPTSITFASKLTSSNRFYLDNVSVVIGSGSYTLSPACCDINLVSPIVTTSSADQSVTVSWPSVKHEGVEAATAYEFTYKLASSSADPTVVPVAATGAASYSQTITGLTNCSNYVFTVEAIGDPNATTTICSSPIASVTTYPGVAYTVNYQYGAGTGTPNVWVSGCANGTSTTLPAVTPNTLAYVFAGWYDGTTRVGGAGDSYIPTADVTLVAQYSAAPTYTLKFVNEGAEILTKTVYSTAAENDRKATEPNANYADYGLELTPLTTACSEAVFVGWTTTQTAAQGTTISPTLVTFPYTISGNATLYALWKITVTEGGGTATDFVKVTSTPSDWSGDYVIVNGTKAMKNTVSGGEMGALDVTISSNTISNPDASIIWTFANTGTDTYSAYNSAVSKYAYITGTKSDNAGLSVTTKNLTIGFKEAGNYDQIQLKGSGTTAARCFSYYSGSTAWRTYATSSNSTGSLYRRVAGTTTYYSSPQCTPMITVDPADVATCISAADLKVAVGGTATSTGHTVAARNCSGTSIVPVITGADHTAFSIDWTAKSLENGRADTVYTVSYKPLTGTSHSAQLQFKTDDGAVVSSTVNLCGTVCTSALFTTQSSTQSSITFAWSASLLGASLRVWNDITGTPSCGPMPYDQTTTLGTEKSKTISGLSASTTFHYQITNGGCVSEVRNITTSAAVGLPVLTASPTLWETMAEANRAATYTDTIINLIGANMPDATVSIALRGETAAFTLDPPATITLVNGAGSIGVTYNPVKAQTNIAYIDLTYTSDCETKTVTITLVGNVPGIDIVEVNPDASGFTLHTDLEGTPNIVLSQEVEHQGSGRQANDLFFSKYFEAAQNTKLVGIYNGTQNPISLRGIRIAAQKAGELSGTKAALWNPSDIISLDTLQSLAPGKEIILFSTTNNTLDMKVVNCVAGSTGWEHEGWYPVNDQTATTVYGSAARNLFKNGTFDNKNASIITSGDRVYGLQRKAVDGTWEFIDVIGAFNGDSVIGRQIKPKTTITGMDEPGWACLNGTNYLTKETAGLSTNRHLLIRKNTVVDGLNALEQNTEDFATLCTEWEGLIVPKNGAAGETEQDITCRHFGEVSTFNYDGYYASFERIDDKLVNFTAASGRPGDWVGAFTNPTKTFQDSLRCYNLKISVERYYDSRDVPPTERSKDYVKNLDPGDDAAEIAALDTVEVMSTQYRVPILVMNGENLTTKDLRFTQLSKDTCRTCDVVVMNGGILTKSNLPDDRDSVRSVFVYNGGRLVVPDGLDYSVQDLSIRAQGDAVGAAYVEGNLLMKNPRIYHDKRIDNSKRYFFTLPYNCAVNKITEMNGKSLGVYGTTWIIQYYDGEQRIINRGLSSNWKMVPYDATLQAGRGYIIAITSDVQKYVRFPMVAEATFTEKNTAKTLDVTQYGELQASSGALGYNNVGWNLVGNPYISYFTSDGVSNDGVNNGTVELGGYYMRNSGGFNENTWTRLETSNIYVTIPNANNIGYTQDLASATQLNPFIAFFVQAQATGTLTFATTSRDSSPSMVAASAKRTNEANAIALNLTVGAETDRTTILLDNYHTSSYEVGADLLKWKDKVWKGLPYFYSFDDKNNPLAFNATNYDEAKTTVPVAFYMPTTGARYTFSIDRSRSNLEELEHVYLLRNGSIVADLLFADYTNTNLSRTQENKQFAISIQRAAEVVTPVNPTEDDALMPRAITERHEVRVEQLPAEGTVMVMDAVGRTIATRTLTGADNMTFELPVDGVYTITVMTPARNYTLKTVIR